LRVAEAARSCCSGLATRRHPVLAVGILPSSHWGPIAPTLDHSLYDRVMQLLLDADFTKWRAAAGIANHPRFPLNLVFSQDPKGQRSWLPTGRITDLPGFLQAAVTLVSDQGPVLLYRKGGDTWYEDEGAPIGNHIIDRVLEAVGVPRDFHGALAFDNHEWRDLYLVISTFAVWGWSVGEDLFIIPKNGSCVLMTSHHGELLANFPSAEALEQFRKSMEGAGHPAR
jgi:hypothetical protein